MFQLNSVNFLGTNDYPESPRKIVMPASRLYGTDYRTVRYECCSGAVIKHCCGGTRHLFV